MSIEPNVVTANLIIKGDPNTACFESVAQFIQSLPQFLVALIPKSITNVIVSNVQPTSAERDSIWVQQNNAGVFVGFRVYSDGKWIQIFPVPNGIERVFGNSNQVPEGFVLANSEASGLTSDQRQWIQDQWYPAGNGPWTIFDIVFVGV